MDYKVLVFLNAEQYPGMGQPARNQQFTINTHTIRENGYCYKFKAPQKINKWFGISLRYVKV